MARSVPKTVLLGSRQVAASAPYAAPETDLVGRERELDLVTAAWMAQENQPLAPLLVGEPGVGKNRLVYHLARRTGKELFIFQGHDDVTVEDLACTVRFGDAPGTMDYVASPLVTAMAEGGICFVDEIAKIRPRALALLVSVLDERRYVDSSLLGERVHAQEGFRFIAATNTADLQGSALPEFIRSRMRPVIHVGHPPREEMDRIVAARYPRFGAELDPLLDAFWALWAAASPQAPPTPRDLLHVFALALSLADYDCNRERRPFPLDGGTPAPSVARRHLELAFRQMFASRGEVRA